VSQPFGLLEIEAEEVAAIVRHDFILTLIVAL
jgi:hypothetical protein